MSILQTSVFVWYFIGMLVFIDESGDSGLKLGRGSSPHFTVSLVIFEDDEEATACDKEIQLLKHKLKWESSDEFHFKSNSDAVRRQFLKAVSPYNFFYYGIVIDKQRDNFPHEDFATKQAFYHYACGLLFENAKEKLDNAKVTIDQSGDLDFKRQLGKYLREKMNSEKSLIRDVKMQRSTSTTLLQLADYVAGAINRSLSQKRKYADDYRQMIKHREIHVQVWP